MVKYKIVIPTRGREQKILTKKLFKKEEIIIVCSNSEVENYKKYNPGNEVIGFEYQYISDFRKKIVEYFWNEIEYLIFLDDDIVSFYNHSGNKIEGEKIIEELINLLDKNYAQSTIAFYPSAWLYKEKGFYKIDTRAWCVVANNLKLFKKFNINYDENTFYFEDYDITMQIISKGLHNVCSYKYSFDCITMGTNEGGCQTYRNLENSQKAIEYMLEKWGDKIKIIYNERTKLPEIQPLWKKLRPK